GQAFIDAFAPFLKEHPTSRATVKRVLADGDLVALHVHSQLNEIYPLALAPTGLLYQSGRKMDADFARYAWDNDQRLHIVPSQLLYGEVQGLEDYLKQLS
ncbi:hypothetical protein ACOART_06805, partial [Glaesserella parasuis]